VSLKYARTSLSFFRICLASCAPLKIHRGCVQVFPRYSIPIGQGISDITTERRLVPDCDTIGDGPPIFLTPDRLMKVIHAYKIVIPACCIRGNQPRRRQGESKAPLALFH
jgi:hypothetical protein